MQSRHIAIALAAAVGAFAGTFGIGKLTSGGDAATPSSGKAPQSFEVSGATVSANAPSAGLPGLMAKPKPTTTPAPTTTPSATPIPTAAPTAAPPPPSGRTGGQGPVTGGGEG